MLRLRCAENIVQVFEQSGGQRTCVLNKLLLFVRKLLYNYTHVTLNKVCQCDFKPLMCFKEAEV